MKRNFVAKMLMISLTASMLLGSTSAFAADLTTSEEPTTITQEVEMSDTSSDEVDETDEVDAQTTEDENQAVAESAESSEDETLAKSSGGATVSYRTHVQTYGWQDYVSNGNMSGTEGQAKRLEGINIKLENQDYEGGITYRTHVQTYGWQDYVSDDAMSGTEGEAKRLEAIQIELTGEMAEHYDIYYRVHSQTYGWLGWAKNGEKAGSSNYAKRLEGIQIVLVEKGGEAPGSTENAYVHPWIGYSTHVQTYGWQGFKFDGDTAGTSGQSKRLEGIQLKLVDQPYEGSIQYKTHVQTYGWQDWVSDGATSGTTGEAKRLEAIQIQLTGEMAEHFDIYYRVHSQTYGWLGWAKNGESAGTEGYGKRLEAIEVLLVEKGNEAPSSDASAFEKAHVHNWVEQTKTVHHDAEYKTEDVYETVTDYEEYGYSPLLYKCPDCDFITTEDQDIRDFFKHAVATGHRGGFQCEEILSDTVIWTTDIPVYKSKYVCFCGETFENLDDWDSHQTFDKCKKGYTTLKIQVGTEKHAIGSHQEKTGTKQVLVKDAYDETVVTGYTCSDCGATK